MINIHLYLPPDHKEQSPLKDQVTNEKEGDSQISYTIKKPENPPASNYDYTIEL